MMKLTDKLFEEMISEHADDPEFPWFRIDTGIMQQVVPVVEMGTDYITVLNGKSPRHIPLKAIVNLQYDPGDVNLIRTTSPNDLAEYMRKEKLLKEIFEDASEDRKTA